jgi:segregation and condensation protein A
MCKQIALQLQQSWVGDDVFVRPTVQVEENKAYLGIHEPDELFLAMSNLNYKDAVRKAVPHVKPAIAKSFVSVFTKIVYVLKRINDGHKVEVNDTKGTYIKKHNYNFAIELAQKIMI